MLATPLGHLFLSLALVMSPQASTAARQVAAQAGPPPSAAKFDIESFRFLLGRWRGQGTFGPSGDPVSSTMTFELENRTTMMIRAAEEPPNTFKYVALWSKEKGSDELLMLMSSSLDGPAIFHSAGWVGDRLIFEPKHGINAGPSSVRFTFVRRNQQAFQLTYEFSINGVWHLGDTQLFTKVE